jgi:O-methyltransferase involved in polyketide biosynthesis
MGKAAGLELAAVDFTRESLTSALDRCPSYDATKPAIVLVEAVLMYLDEEVVRDVFRQLRSRPARTRVIFTFFEPRPGRAHNFQNATRIADLWLQRVGEPARWAVAPEQVEAFLRGEKFELVRLWRDRDYQRNGLSDDVPLPRGEHIAVAEHRP